MKISTLFLILVSFNIYGQKIDFQSVSNCNRDNIESLNIKNKKSSWYKVYYNDFKIPKVLKNKKLIHEIIDYDQVVYQSCNGQIWDKGKIKGWINRWGIDTARCSPRKINSFINGIIGQVKGKNYYIIDLNNNFDFTDDKMYEVSDTMNNQHIVQFERFEAGKKTIDTVEISVLKPKKTKSNELIGIRYKYCSFRKANFNYQDKVVDITLYPGSWYLYHKEPLIKINIVGQKEQVLTNNQYFNIGNDYFKISEIDKKGHSLSIKKSESSSLPISNQVGCLAPDFKINDSTMISDLKDKTLFVYFWNIECSACERELPKLFQENQKNANDSIAFILVSVDKLEASKKFLSDNKITWINIPILGNSDLFNNYGINHFPTKYLIDKKGKIIDVDNFRLEDYVK